MQKRILITGAAGFIGFHFAKACLEAGFSVVGIDIFSPYYSVDLKKERAKILRNMGLEVQNIDICDRAKLEQLVSENDITHIVHLAAQAGVRYSFTHPEVYLKTNIEGFLQVLETCRMYPHVKLIYASSSSVYGDNKKIPFSESDTTDHQTNVYGVSKKTNELMAYSYHHLYKIPSIGLRFFTVYGPWGRPDMALFLFTKAILADEPIKVFNQGQMIRDFTYIDDIVEGIIRVADRTPLPNPDWNPLQSDPAQSSAPYRVYNIGNNQPVQLGEFIAAIEKALGKKAIKELLPMQAGDVAATSADVRDLEADTGYKPSTTVEKGIQHFIDWYRWYYQV